MLVNRLVSKYLVPDISPKILNSDNGINVKNPPIRFTSKWGILQKLKILIGGERRKVGSNENYLQVWIAPLV